MNIHELIPIPNLLQARSVLCIQPHPDDNEIGAGGTIARLASLGCEVHYLTISQGKGGSETLRSSELVALRQQELKAAGQTLGVKSFHQLDLVETHYPDEKTLTSAIVAIIRKLKPQGVVTVDPTLKYEAHPTHRKTGSAALDACLFSSQRHFPIPDGELKEPPHQVEWIAFYGSAHPNVTLDVTAQFQTKLAAIACHKTQFTPASLTQLSQYLGMRAQLEGQKIGSPLAESFKVLPMILTHMMVESESY